LDIAKAGIRSKVRRKFRVSTDSKHHFAVAPNLFERNFAAEAPDRVWVADITYLATRTGWLYWTVIIDLFSRMVVGWALSSSLSHDMPGPVPMEDGNNAIRRPIDTSVP
jgi:putative transposase